MSHRAPGQVITFYSFKGGVGRTMALANVAALHAQRGKKVLALDFDFEAPGLHRYFLEGEHSSFQRFSPWGPQDGVIDFFYALRERLHRRWPDGEGFQEPSALAQVPGIIEEVLDAGAYLYQVKLRNPNARKAPPVEIAFIATARFDKDYAERVRRFNWQAFYDAYAEVFPLLAAELSRRYDYVLIDSRTGLTDIGSICTMMFPDKLVLVFSPNDQSLRGALEAGWQSVQERKASADRRPLPLFPLLSRVENSEESLKRQWVDKARGEFERMFRAAYGLEHCDLETYFNLVRIPHQSYYAYGEKIAAEERPAIEMGSLAQAFQQFVECLDCAGADEAQQMLESKSEEEQRAIESAVLDKLKDEGALRELIRQRPNEPALQIFLANLLRERNRLSEAIAVYEEVVRRFGHATDLRLQGAVASALFNKGFVLGELGRHDEEVATYDEMLRRFGDAPDLLLRLQVARALINKGVHLVDLGRVEEAASTCEEVLRRFGEAPDLALREPVARALNGIGFHRLLEAKRIWQTDDESAARTLLDEAEAKLAAAQERAPDNPFILGNAGYIAFLRGHEDEARTLLARAIQLGGEQLRQTELNDADLHSLPQDEAFRALVRSLPGPLARGTTAASPSADPPAPSADPPLASPNASG